MAHKINRAYKALQQERASNFVLKLTPIVRLETAPTKTVGAISKRA